MDKDVTELVEFNFNDDELLPITRCVCGKKFKSWTFNISIYRDAPLLYHCPSCGRGLYFSLAIRVFERID
jgi:hypothetical protein